MTDDEIREEKGILALAEKWREFIPEHQQTFDVMRCVGMYEACVDMAPSFRFTNESPPGGPSLFCWWASHGGENYGEGIHASRMTTREFGNLVLHAYQCLKIIVGKKLPHG